MSITKSKAIETEAVKCHPRYVISSLIGEFSMRETCTVLIAEQLPQHGDFIIAYQQDDHTVAYAIILLDRSKSIGDEQLTQLEDIIDSCNSLYRMLPIWASIISLDIKTEHHDGLADQDYVTEQGVRIRLIHDILPIGCDGCANVIGSLILHGALDVKAALSLKPSLITKAHASDIRHLEALVRMLQADAESDVEY